MCTALLLKANKNVVFGRTMDFSYDIDLDIFVIPRNDEWNSLINNYKIYSKYKIIGTGQDIGEIVLVDGINEKGLGVAALYFKNYAFFDNKVNFEKNSIGSIELVRYLLSNCADIDEVIWTINSIQIVGLRDSVTNSIAPLHWFVVDASGRCITIEKVQDGLKIYENNVGVLTNSPDFKWHITNLNNYVNLSPNQESYVVWNKLRLASFSEGGGTIGLPGDYTSPSRFVRTAFLKSFIVTPSNVNDIINNCFHIMESVSIPKGIVMINDGSYDYTQYVVFMDVDNGDYYFKTYDNPNIRKVNINDMYPNKVTSLGKLKSKASF